jgi:O-methyltransferase involved in polyketide biosynthesis
MDLADVGARRALFERLGREHRRVFVIAEGLLLYLDAADVLALARDLRAQPSFHWWLIDLANPMLLQWMQKSWGKHAAEGNAPFKFAPEEGTAFFAPAGWRELEFRSSFLESRRLKRTMRGAWIWAVMGLFLSKERKEKANRMAGIVLLGSG